MCVRACVCVRACLGVCLKTSAHSHYLCAGAVELEGVEDRVNGVNGCDVRFSKSGGPLFETLSESKSFLKRQTLLIFLLSNIFLRLYKK